MNHDKNKITMAIEVYLNTIQDHGDLSVEERERMVSSITNFVDLALRKYIAGKHEHGGDLLDRQLFKEMKWELVDFFHYSVAAEAKQAKLYKLLEESNPEKISL